MIRRQGRLRRLRIGVPGIVSRIGWSGTASSLPMLGLLIMTPFLISHLGLERYGVWSLVTTLVLFGTGLDGGIGAVLLRWFGIERHNPDRRFSTRLTTTAVGLIVVCVVVLTVAAWFLAEPASTWIKAAPDVRQDAVLAFTVLPALVGLPLLTSVFNALLQAHGRFRAVAVRSALAESTFVVVALTLVPGHGLAGLLVAAMAQQVLGLTAACVAARRHLALRAIGLLSCAEVRPLAAFAAQVQASAVSNLVMLESDAVLIAVILPVQYVGLYGVGAQVASALRSIPIFALPAVYSHLLNVYGEARETYTAAVRSTIDTFERGWTRHVSSYCLVASACAFAAVVSWVGPGLSMAGFVAAALMIGYTFNLLTGVASTVLRVLQRPGLETKWLVISAIVNLALSVPLALMFGLWGIVSATVIAQVIGSVAFRRAAARIIGAAGGDAALPGVVRQIPVSAVPVAVVAGTVCTLVAVNVESRAGAMVLCGVTALGCLGALTVANVRSSARGRSGGTPVPVLVSESNGGLD